MDGRLPKPVEVVGPPPAAAHVPVEIHTLHALDEEDAVPLYDQDDNADLEYEYFMKQNSD